MTTSKPTAISLFSGMGGDSLGIQDAGFDVIAFNEFDKAAVNSHLHNFPNSTLIQDPTQKNANDIQLISDQVFSEYKGKVDLVFAGHPCFVAGTKILTGTGYKKIEDVLLKDKLLTHTGRLQDILNLQHKMYSGRLLILNIKYNCEDIVCTEEHPFYVRENRKGRTSSSNKYDGTFGEPVWKSAKELSSRDYFGMVINSNEITPTLSFINPIDKVIRKVINNTTQSNNIETIVLDKPEYWFLMGYFVGDGWIQNTTSITSTTAGTQYEILFTIHDDIHDNEQAEIVNGIRQVLPITDTLTGTGNCKIFNCSDFIWYNLLKQFGTYALDKQIPEWVQDAPVEYIGRFIEGYKKSSGYTRKSGVPRFSTVSYNLAFGLQRLYLKLGYIFGIEKSIRPKTCIIQGHKVERHHTYCIRAYTRTTLRSHSAFIENGYVWYPPYKQEEAHVENISVYNFEVKNDNSYVVANVVVHNCQGFSNGGKKLPDDPRNTLFREFARVSRLVNPKYIIGENVDGLLNRKTASGENYIDVIVKEFDEIGYNVSYQVCHIVKYGVPQLRKRLVYVGIRKDLGETYTFPEPLNDGKNNLPNLQDIVRFDMKGSIKIEHDDFDMKTIPDECILKDLTNDEVEIPTDIHPYLRLKAKTRNQEYNGKVHPTTLSFSKRDSPIHAEIIDIRNPSKTIICTYDHQPRLFVPLQNKNGYYLRCILPDELKQIQGFPCDFTLHGSTKDKVKQIGNAVPPPLITQIVKKLRSSE